jgi:hypothetical protein
VKSIVTPYWHPTIGAASLLLLLYVASLGFRMRTARRGRAQLTALHARLAPIAYAAVLVSWLIGAGSALWLRSDFEFASTLHFRTGCIMAALLTGSADALDAQRECDRTRRASWLGAAAVLLAAAHAPPACASCREPNGALSRAARRH